MSIELFNPKDIPFGSLSNNSFHNMLICDEKSLENKNTIKDECDVYSKWRTVTQFIYSNMIPNYVYKDIIKNKKYNYKDKESIYKDYLKYKQKSSNDIITNSLNEALKVKFENPDMLKILLSTGDATIVYTSNNELLGSGSNNTGSNFVGLYLMQLRDNIKNTKIIYEKNIENENNLFKSYILFGLLSKDITTNLDDLSNYMGTYSKTLDDLFTEYLNRKPSSELKQKFKQEVGQRLLDNTEKKFLMERLKTETELKTLLELSVSNPLILILYLRNKYIKTLKENLKFVQLNKIFNLYVDYILETKFPDIDPKNYELAKNSQFKKISGSNQDELKNQVYNKMDDLPKPLYSRIQEYLKTIKVPTDEEIIYSTKFNLSYFTNMDKTPDINEKTANKIIKIIPGNPSINYVDDLRLVEENSLQLLSPIYYTGMLKIKGLLYPTVTHYIIANLFASIPSVETLKNSRDYMIVNKDIPLNIPVNWKNYAVLSDEYFQVSKKEEIERLKYLATVGINKKFQDRHLQKLLSQTGNKKIIWNDYEDEILGVGNKKQGENFVGKYLMEVRAILIKKQHEENENIVDKKEISELIKNDYFMIQWVNSKIEDICNTVKNISSFLEKKYRDQQPINFPREKGNYEIRENLHIAKTEKLFIMTMDKIYKSCAGIISVKDLNIEVPEYFIKIVKNNLSSQYKSPKIFQFLWKYIISLLYFLIENIKNPTIYNIKNALIKIEEWNSSKKICKKILDDNYSNCIISAIINLLSGIYDFTNDVRSITIDVGGAHKLIEQKITRKENKIFSHALPGLREEYKNIKQPFIINPIITIENINLVSSIILNKNLKISDKLFEEDKPSFHKKDEDNEYTYEENESEKSGDNFFDIYPDEEVDEKVDEEVAEEEKSDSDNEDYEEESEHEEENNDYGDGSDSDDILALRKNMSKNLKISENIFGTKPSYRDEDMEIENPDEKMELENSYDDFSDIPTEDEEDEKENSDTENEDYDYEEESDEDREYGDREYGDEDREYGDDDREYGDDGSEADDVAVLKKFLEKNKIFNEEAVNDYDELSKNIIKYVNVIKKYNISKEVKLNRINFFNF